MTPREYLDLRLRLQGEHPFVRFMLDGGKDYAVGPETYAGRRGAKNRCYMNAAQLAFETELTYVEGMMSILGVVIDHAWCVNADGIVIDPTLKEDGGDVSDYFGVPFLTDYVREAALRNKYYGLLDIHYARKTLPKLVELGLEQGQQWLLGKTRRSYAR